MSSESSLSMRQERVNHPWPQTKSKYRIPKVCMDINIDDINIVLQPLILCNLTLSGVEWVGGIVIIAH